MSDNHIHKRKPKNIRDVIIESIECEPGLEGCTGDPDTCLNEPNKCDKKLSMFGYYDDTIKNSVEHVLSESLDELTHTFTASARRWQMIVYPSMFAFVLLASFGFFLIYSLTNDVTKVANEMGRIGNNMQNVVVHMESVAGNMSVMTQTMDVQSRTMQEMNAHVRNMSLSVNRISHDVAILNDSVSKPMQFMNNYMPWQ
jgi:uncharacterized protein YoxC